MQNAKRREGCQGKTITTYYVRRLLDIWHIARIKCKQLYLKTVLCISHSSLTYLQKTLEPLNGHPKRFDLNLDLFHLFVILLPHVFLDSLLIVGLLNDLLQLGLLPLNDNGLLLELVNFRCSVDLALRKGTKRCQRDIDPLDSMTER